MEIKVTPNANDIKITPQLYEVCAEKGHDLGRKLTLSALLEEINPSQPEDKLDAFDRQLKRFGIIAKDDPDKGIFASSGALFFQSNMPESRVLFPEFIERSIRAALMDETDYLSYLTSNWTTSYAGLFRSFYIDDTATTKKSGRRGEGAGMAKMKVTWSEKAVSLKDFGIMLEMSYEFVRWASLPMIQTILTRAALQRRYDEAAEAIYVIVNGDGSAKEGGVAGNTNLGTLQTAHVGTESLEYASWLKWAAGFRPGQLSTVIANTNDVIKFILIAKPTSDPIFLYNLLNKGLTGGVPQIANLGIGGLIALCHDDVATDILIGIDKRFAIQGYRDMGMDLVETNKIIDGKFEQIAISNKVGFAKIFSSASKTLTTNA